jgi:glycosyltransferase involved in cell wall biosynthesis
MVRETLGFDIGLFPLFRNVESRARGTLKAMVYMSGGAVALCEDFGENSKLIQDGVNGMLASSSDGWYEKLRHLVEHPEDRAAISRLGLETIRQRFSASAVFGQLTAAFDGILGGQVIPTQTANRSSRHLSPAVLS